MTHFGEHLSSKAFFWARSSATCLLKCLAQAVHFVLTTTESLGPGHATVTTATSTGATIACDLNIPQFTTVLGTKGSSLDFLIGLS